MTVDPDAPGWAYQQAADVLRRRLQTGEFGRKLPSNMALAQELGISVMTLQKALGVLKDEGLIYTEPGRGTFVRQQGKAP